MINIPGYELSRKLSDSATSVVFRGVRADGLPVVLKVLDKEYPSSGELERYRHEFEILHGLTIEGCVRCHDLLEHRRTLALVLEDLEAISLSEFLVKRGRTPIPVLEFLPIAIQLAKIVAELHQAGIIHRDINPANILINPENGELRVIDFGISTRFSRERLVLAHPSLLCGTMAYMSPEQTGRVNRTLDHRTDLYSLGATFYELLCGRLPFNARDPLSLIHAHLAKEPLPLLELNHFIPPMLSQIVAKLMAKNAEVRYQSGMGLVADLETCLQRIETRDVSATFTLGRSDFRDGLRVPERLYGRQKELQQLTAIFERAANHRSRSTSGAEALLVTGRPGVGKTSLVRELYKSVTASRGLIAAGKFEQLQRTTPYLALRQALATLVRHVLSEPDSVLQHWKAHFVQALGPNTRLINEWIPAFEGVVGPYSELPPATTTETKNRFELTFERFIGVFCSDQPLLLFLDDLQWADSASLGLIERLLSHNDQPGFLVVGAYRDEEVGHAHPLALTLDRMRRAGAKLEEMHLEALAVGAIEEILTETLQCDAEEVESLAKLLVRKTAGNPFFVGQFLSTLETDGLIFFDTDRHRWRWDQERIASAVITDNVAELMALRLQRLPKKTLQILRAASVAGTELTLETLAAVVSMPTSAVLENLSPAIQQGMVLCASHVNDTEITNSLRFGHDRVHLATYEMTPQPERSAIHLRLARLLRTAEVSNQLSDGVFATVDHYNLAQAALADPGERQEVAQLNLEAAQRAKTSVAYRPSLAYAQAGLALIDEDAWEADYDLALALYNIAAEAARLSGEYDLMGRFVGIILEHAKVILDMVPAYQVQITAAQALTQQLEAVETGRQVLARLGVQFPLEAGPEDVGAALAATNAVLGDRDPIALAELPRMSDPKTLAAMSVLTKMDTSLYQVAPSLYVIAALLQVRLSIEKGNCPASASAYAMYAVVLCGVTGQPKVGYRFGELALLLLDQMPAAPKTKIHMIFNTHLGHWNRHMAESIVPLSKTCEEGQLRGDQEFTAHAANALAWYFILSGRPLNDIIEDIAAYSKSTERAGQLVPLAYLNVAYQIALNLLGRSDDPLKLEGFAYREDESLPRHEASGDLAALFCVHFGHTYLHYLLGSAEESVNSALLTEAALGGVPAFVAVPPFYFYAALAHLRLPSDRIDDVVMEKVADYQEKLAFAAETAPWNYQAKWTLVEAERYRVLGAHTKATEAYDEAIKLSEEHGFIQEQALAYELAAQFHFERNKEVLARAYLVEAHFRYERWGAEVKLHALENQYRELALRDRRAWASKIDLTTGSSTASTDLDFDAALRAAQSLSGEIVLTSLLSKLVRLLLEYGGAQKGHLILGDEDALRIEASGSDVDGVSVLQSLPLEGEVPESVVRYVRRSGEPVILEDAHRQGRFVDNDLISKKRIRSLLCTAIRYQTELVGVIYLENNLAPGTFSPERVQLLEILAAQAAVSISNAKLNSTLEQLENLAALDGLTKLPNRRSFDETLAQEWARGIRERTQLALVIIDIDHFKHFNDTYGHAAGDDCLVAVAAALRKSVFRPADVLARYGGEEFVAVLPDTDDAAALVIAKRLVTEVQALEIRHSMGIGGIVTISAGIATVPPSEGSSPRDLLEAADARLYLAKETGRNRVC